MHIEPSGKLKFRVQLMCGDEAAMGPGKEMVLQAIAQTGSISAAGRELGMSYRRIWLLVDSMNRCWSAPLVSTSTAKGAHLTELGHTVLEGYRQMMDRIEAAARAEGYDALVSHIRNKPVTPTAPSHPQAPRD